MPDERVTRVTLLRHGEVEAFDQRIVRGQSDVPLSTRGIKQSGTVAEWLTRAVPDFDALYSSDLSRCQHLANRLHLSTDLDVELDPRLREQSMGEWQGRTWNEITAQDGPRVTAYWDNYVETTPPGGESLLDLQKRVTEWWDETHARHAGKRIAVATHIGVIRTLLCSLLHIPLEDALRFAPAVGSITSLLISEAGTVVESFGERPWLWRDDMASLSRSVQPAARIALSGSAGTGKTTLGRALADRLGVPFIEEGMRTRIENGFDIHSLDVGGLRNLVRELWEEQLEAQAAAGDAYVVDRSSIDYAAFWLHYSLYEEREETDSFIADLCSAAPRYDRILLFPWGVLPMEADGVRATNRWLQLRYQTILEGLLERYTERERITRVPNSIDFDERLRAVEAAIENQPS